MYQISDGKTVSAYVKQQVKDEVAELAKNGSVPALAVIIVGDDPASKVYVGNKKKACEMTGMKSIEYALDENTSESELLELIGKLNNDKEINGILCQLPLPKHINEETILNSIAVEKDVDAFHPSNVGRIMIGDYDFVPCTPAGIMEMIKEDNQNTIKQIIVILADSKFKND